MLQAAAFSGILLAFYVASSLRLTDARLRQFLIVVGVMTAYNFVVSLNQHYGFLAVDTPLLGLTRELFYATTNAYGTFGSAFVQRAIRHDARLRCCCRCWRRRRRATASEAQAALLRAGRGHVRPDTHPRQHARRGARGRS